jgi:hypothetical protein
MILHLKYQFCLLNFYDALLLVQIAFAQHEPYIPILYQKRMIQQPHLVVMETQNDMLTKEFFEKSHTLITEPVICCLYLL